jgi:hypothetical protein
MGSEIDVMKLRSSLELFLSVAPKSDQPFRTLATEIIGVLK